MQVGRTHPMCAVCVVTAVAWFGQWTERRESEVSPVHVPRELEDDCGILTRLEHSIWGVR